MPRRSKRDINGVLLLNKPKGITSNDAMVRIRGIFYAQKAGHTGALDPLATGMLPICLGEATKYSQFLLDADKSYEVEATFGIRTTTSDAEGEIISKKDVNFSEADLLSAISKFVGNIQQIPSMYSALKYQGRPYYEYARKGIEIPREARYITIFEFRLDEFNKENHTAKMYVHCSKGTYIRSLIDDLGEYLGCGAHVSMLNRIGVADYPIDRMVTFETIDDIVKKSHEAGFTAFEALDSLLLPVDSAVQRLPKIFLSEEEGKDILLGKRLKVTPVNMLTTDLQPIRIYVGSENNPDKSEFIGVGEIAYDHLSPKRLIATAKTNFSDEIIPKVER
ncbi:MAG: tRNA pseudouridine(55) synthase TruB [Succinivibrionaceae bacterium]